MFAAAGRGLGDLAADGPPWASATRLARQRPAQCRWSCRHHRCPTRLARLLLATLLAGVAINIGRLGTSLSMQALQFDLSAVVSTATVSGLITIPIVLLIGALVTGSDEGAACCSSCPRDRRRAGVEYGHAALAFLAGRVAGGLSPGVPVVRMAAAYATERMLPPERLGRNLPRLSAIESAASILGFASTGYVLICWGRSASILGRPCWHHRRNYP